jgi:tRNA(Ile2) C34 agmatinyltransferase TiaS
VAVVATWALLLATHAEAMIRARLGPMTTLRRLATLRLRFFDPADPRCTRCNYSLIGLTEPRCPECGQRFGAAVA